MTDEAPARKLGAAGEKKRRAQNFIPNAQGGISEICGQLSNVGQLNADVARIRSRPSLSLGRSE